jgi:hypothetical protein
MRCPRSSPCSWCSWVRMPPCSPQYAHACAPTPCGLPGSLQCALLRTLPVQACAPTSYGSPSSAMECERCSASPCCCAGDADQLPPVGAGSFLSAVIRSGAVPVVDLRQVFRQV